MKLIATSDLHGYLPDINPADVLCIAGDISPLEHQSESDEMIAWIEKDFIPWIDNLPVNKVFFVAGNHDFAFDSNIKGAGVRKTVLDLISTCPKATYLENNVCEYDGKLFYGSPNTIGPLGWAFYEKDLSSIGKSFPDNADVAIFHQPLSYEDNGRVLQEGHFLYGVNFGSELLDKMIDRYQPNLVLTGHVHSGNHNVAKLGESKIVNVSIKDEHYKPKYQMFETEI